jgi:hypothetical protein
MNCKSETSIAMTISDTSIQTINEISVNKQKFFKIFLGLLCIVNSLLGVHLLFQYISYFNEKSESEFAHIDMLKYYIYGYTYILLISLAFSIVTGIIVIIIDKIFKCSKTDKLKENISLNLNHETFNENEFNFINVSVVIFIFSVLIFYTVAIPTGIYLIINLLKNSNFGNFQRFFLLYVFIANNTILGVIVVSILIYALFFIHIKLSNRQPIILDEELVEKIEKEIKDTHKISGTISSKKGESLIKMNSLFNKQGTSTEKRENGVSSALSNKDSAYNLNNTSV